MSNSDKKKTQLSVGERRFNKSVEKITQKKADAYKEKHGETVTKEDYDKYKESFKSPEAHYDLAKPLSFSDYKNIAGFYGKSMAKDASLELVMKAGLDPEKYRPKEKMNKGGMVKSRTGPADYRKGGMVLATMDRRKKK